MTSLYLKCLDNLKEVGSETMENLRNVYLKVFQGSK